MHGVGDGVQIRVEQVGIGIQGYLRGLVSEHPLQRQDVHAGRHRQAGGGMPADYYQPRIRCTSSLNPKDMS